MYALARVCVVWTRREQGSGAVDRVSGCVHAGNGCVDRGSECVKSGNVDRGNECAGRGRESVDVASKPASAIV